MLFEISRPCLCCINNETLEQLICQVRCGANYRLAVRMHGQVGWEQAGQYKSIEFTNTWMKCLANTNKHYESAFLNLNGSNGNGKYLKHFFFWRETYGVIFISSAARNTMFMQIASLMDRQTAKVNYVSAP